MQRRNTRLCTLLLTLATGCGDSKVEKPGASPKGSPPADEVALKTLDFDGTLALVKSHVGKVVVVDCWSTL